MIYYSRVQYITYNIPTTITCVVKKKHKPKKVTFSTFLTTLLEILSNRNEISNVRTENLNRFYLLSTPFILFQ